MNLLNTDQYIKPVRGHYEAYTSGGEFICSGDTFNECSDVLIEIIKAEAVKMLRPVAVSA